MSPDLDDDLVGALSRMGTATLGESGALVAHPRLRPIWSGATVCAPVYPVRCTPGDNLALHVAVTRAPRGSVLVADVGDLAERGYWGEVLTTAAEATGLAGLVIDGGVRDIAALEAHRFAVFATVVALAGATKDRAGAVGRPVSVGGVLVEEGDWVVGDVDGVVFVPGAALGAVLDAAEARAAREKVMFEALRSGSTILDLLHLDPTLVDGDSPAR